MRGNPFPTGQLGAGIRTSAARSIEPKGQVGQERLYVDGRIFFATNGAKSIKTKKVHTFPVVRPTSRSKI
jgi:hypothetical protein